MTPPPMTAGEATFLSAGNPKTLESQIVPTIREFYFEERNQRGGRQDPFRERFHYHVQLIDVFKIMVADTNFQGQNKNLFHDGMHLSRRGSQRLARLVVNAMKSNNTDVIDKDDGSY